MALEVSQRLFGFAIGNGDGICVTVDLEPWTFVVKDPAGGLEAIGLPDAEEMPGRVQASLGRVTRRQRSRFPLERRQIDTAVRVAVRGAAARLLERVPDEVAQVHRAVSGATGLCGGVHGSPAFYRRPYLARDVMSFRAAAIAVGHATGLCRPEPRDRESLLDRLERWPELFSPAGSSYRSLRRTLAHLPAAVPSGLVCLLRHVELPRAVTSALELEAICASIRIGSSPGAGQLQRILLHAREDEIAAAVRRVAEATRQPVAATTSSDALERALRYLADCPDRHEGRLGGLVTKAVRWHRSWSRRSLADTIRQAGFDVLANQLDRPTTPPPWPLPPVPGLRFLATVEDVARESQEMNHCVATRVAAAVTGRAFLFHVEHEGACATVELSDDGRVEEAAGPRNAHNDAVLWGTQVLRQWWSEATRPAPRDSRSARRRSQAYERSTDREWARAAERLRGATGTSPGWLSQLERFRARVLADERDGS